MNLIGQLIKGVEIMEHISTGGMDLLVLRDNTVQVHTGGRCVEGKVGDFVLIYKGYKGGWTGYYAVWNAVDIGMEKPHVWPAVVEPKSEELVIAPLRV